MYFEWIESFDALRLDIVGIVAVLGEGCTARLIDASALSWNHILPRLLPAPQALLRHERLPSLPTAEGMVIGVYSGNYYPRLNFFCRLIHNDIPDRNTVVFCEVRRNDKYKDYLNGQAFGVKPSSILSYLSGLGCLAAFVLLALSIYFKDGFAVVATILLAATSSTVGFASWWTLEFKEEKPKDSRKKDIPSGSVVVYYPNGAFRIVKCPEEISRLYFKPDVCKPQLSDNQYRLMALLASSFLMTGLLCMGNAQTPLQVAFAVAYIGLNIVYWSASALDPMKHHWIHGYTVVDIPFQDPTEPKNRALAQLKLDNPLMSSKEILGSPTQLSMSPTALHNHSRLPGRQDQAPQGTELTKRGNTQQARPAKSKNGQNGDVEANQAHFRRHPVRTLTDEIKKHVPRSFNLYTRQTPPGPKTRPSDLSSRVGDDGRRFTDALWTAIAITGSSRWLDKPPIVPDTDVWREWKKQAGKHARSNRNQEGRAIPNHKTVNGKIELPIWAYNRILGQLMAREDSIVKGELPEAGTHVDSQIIRAELHPLVKMRLRRWHRDAKSRVDANELAKPIALDWAVAWRLKRAREGKSLIRPGSTAASSTAISPIVESNERGSTDKAVDASRPVT